MNAHVPISYPAAPRIARRRAWLRGMAWFCAALVLSIIGLSAHMRLSRVDPACQPWPQCQQAQALDADAPGAPPAARAAHRMAASAALLLVLAMLAVALGPRPILWPEGRMALGLLGLALFLAVLGMAAGASALPAVTLGNLLGGFAMFALSVRLATRRTRVGHGRLAATAPHGFRLALLLALVQVALGGLVSAGQAGLSCPAFGACDLGAGGWQAFNPWIEPAAGTPPTHAGGAWLHMTHRGVGLALAVMLAMLSWRAWRRGARAFAAVLAGLPVALVTLGLALVALGLPLALVLAHNLCAALLLALLASAPDCYSPVPDAGP